MSRGAHHRLRIAPEEETDRTEVRAPGAGVQNDGQQASAEAACGLCRAAAVEAAQRIAPQKRSLLCPLSERRCRHPLLFAVLDLLVLLDQDKSTEERI